MEKQRRWQTPKPLTCQYSHWSLATKPDQEISFSTELQCILPGCWSTVWTRHSFDWIIAKLLVAGRHSQKRGERMATVQDSWLKRADLTVSKVLFHLFFWGSHIGIFAVGWYAFWRLSAPGLRCWHSHRYLQASNPKLAPLNALSYSVWISRGAGLVLSVDCTLILFPMCRNFLRWIRPQIRWLPLDESAWFHRQVAYAILVFTAIHTASHYVK